MSFYTKRLDNYNVDVLWGRVVASIVLLVVVVIAYSALVSPHVRVYTQDLQGQANLRQQEWEKRISIEGAKALKESATLQAQAEVERAKGVAEANKIIADSLRDNEAYLRYLWIDKMADNQNVIYVPTEASLPILEAGKRNI